MSLFINIKQAKNADSAIRVALSLPYTEWKSDSTNFMEKCNDKEYYNKVMQIHKENLSLYNSGLEISDFKPYPDYVFASPRKGYYVVKIFTSF